MGRISVVGYKPKPGKDNELRELIAGRVPLLRKLGFATDRTPILMRSRNGTFVEIAEWASDEAIEAAHEHPEVLAMWEKFYACCNFEKISELPEAPEDFANFTPAN